MQLLIAKAPLALAIMAGAVVPASIGLVPIAILAGAAIAMLVTEGDRTGRSQHRHRPHRLGKRRGREWISQFIALGLQYLPAAGVLKPSCCS